MIDRIRKIASSSYLRALLPNAIPFAYAADVDRFVYKDEGGTVRTLVQNNDSAPFAGISGAVQYAEVTISTAEVLALFAAPKTLVAAPGAGKMLVFHNAVVILDYAGVAYAGVAAGEDIAIRYTDASGVICSTTLESTGFIDATADAMRTIKPLVTDITPVANVPLVFHILTGEITTGTSPLRVKVWYSIVDTGL